MVEDKPPLTIRSILSICWALTLKFTSQKNQTDLGDDYGKWIGKVVDEYRKVGETHEGLLLNQKNKEKMFLENLNNVLFKTLRNIGFAKTAHLEYIKSKQMELATKKKWYDEVTNFASFSKEGLPAKVLTFLTGGSIFTVAKIQEVFSQNVDKSKLQSLQDLVANMENGELKEKMLEDIANLGSSAFSAQDIAFFIIFGVGGMMAFTVIMTLTRYKNMNRLAKEISNDQQKYWKKNYKPEMVDLLFGFYEDIVELFKRFYPNYTDDELFPTPDEYRSNTLKIRIRSVIEKNILPSYRITPDFITDEDKGGKE